jgi:hypothetical protein
VDIWPPDLPDQAAIDIATGVLMGLHEDMSPDQARARLERSARLTGVEPATLAHVIARSQPYRTAIIDGA